MVLGNQVNKRSTSFGDHYNTWAGALPSQDLVANIKMMIQVLCKSCSHSSALANAMHDGYYWRARQDVPVPVDYGKVVHCKSAETNDRTEKELPTALGAGRTVLDGGKGGGAHRGGLPAVGRGEECQ
jgi:hypothetical protein